MLVIGLLLSLLGVFKGLGELATHRELSPPTKANVVMLHIIGKLELNAA